MEVHDGPAVMVVRGCVGGGGGCVGGACMRACVCMFFPSSSPPFSSVTESRLDVFVWKEAPQWKSAFLELKIVACGST